MNTKNFLKSLDKFIQNCYKRQVKSMEKYEIFKNLVKFNTIKDKMDF